MRKLINLFFMLNFCLFCVTMSSLVVCAAAQITEANTSENESEKSISSKEKNAQEVSPSFLPALYKTSGNRLLRAGSWGLRQIMTSRLVTKIGGFFPSFAAKRIPLIGNMAYWLHQKNINHFLVTNKIDENDLSIFEPGSVKEYKSLSKSYATFDEFFTRKITESNKRARLQAYNDAGENKKFSIISPADCQLCVIQNLKNVTTFSVKGGEFNLTKFLGDPVLAGKYLGGILMIFRLRPRDYHRFHFPFQCDQGRITKITGGLHSVNPVAYNSGYVPIIENERYRMTLTPRDEVVKSTMLGGCVMAVVIGALMVGKIKINTPDGKIDCELGEEWGHFSFGGSSIALIFPKDTIKVSQEITDALALQEPQKQAKKAPVLTETYVRMGQIIATFKNRDM